MTRWQIESAFLVQMARHLRFEHGMGVRKIGKRLGLSDGEVKRYCNDGAR